MPTEEKHEIKMMYAIYADGREEPIVIDEIKDLSLEEAEPILEEHNFVKVTRCKDCKFAEEITKNADLNYLSLLHCTKWRGEPVHNVWIKYKKVYADFSIVEKDDFCSSGKRKENERNMH